MQALRFPGDAVIEKNIRLMFWCASRVVERMLVAKIQGSSLVCRRPRTSCNGQLHKQQHRQRCSCFQGQWCASSCVVVLLCCWPALAHMCGCAVAAANGHLFESQGVKVWQGAICMACLI